MAKARELPKRGYYVWRDQLTGENINITFTTGVPGKGGHKYYRVMDGRPWGWCTLLWSCVPRVKDCCSSASELGPGGLDMDKGPNYVYYPALPPGIPPIPGGEPA